MKRILEILFWATLVAFLLCGAVVVFGQLAGVLLLDGDIISGAGSTVSDLTFSLATACAFIAFVLQYFKRRAGESEDYDM